MRKLTVRRETLTSLERGDLALVVAASVSCPINRLREQVRDLTAQLVQEPDTGIPTYCHCP